MNNGKILAAVLALQGVILWGQWTGGQLPAAHAQLPDSGAQRTAMLDELKALNAKMDRLISVMEGGKLQVHVVQSDDSSGKPSPAQRSR